MMEEICIAILVSTLVQDSWTYPNLADINISGVNPNESTNTMQMKNYLNRQKINKKEYIGASNIGINIPNYQEKTLNRNYNMLDSKREAESYSRTIANFTAAKTGTIADGSTYLYATPSINGKDSSINLKETSLTCSTPNASEGKTYEINSSYLSFRVISTSPSPPFLTIKYTVHSTMTNSAKTSSINLDKVHNFSSKPSSTNYPVDSITSINSSFITQKESLTSSSLPHIVHTIATSRAREVMTTAHRTNTVDLDKGRNFTSFTPRMSYAVSPIAFISSSIKTVEMVLVSTSISLMTEFRHLMNGTATTLNAGIPTTTYRTSKIEKGQYSTYFPLKTSYPVSSIANINSSLVTSKLVFMSTSPSITTEHLHTNNITTTNQTLRVETTAQRTNTISLEKSYYFTNSPSQTTSSLAQVNWSMVATKKISTSIPLTTTNSLFHITNATVTSIKHSILSEKNSSQSSQLFTTIISSSNHSAIARSVGETLLSALPPTTSSPVTIALSSPSFLLSSTNSILAHSSTLTAMELTTSKLSTGIIAVTTTSFVHLQESSSSIQASLSLTRSSITSKAIILSTETKSAPSSMITIKHSSELSHITVARTSVIPSTTVVPKTTSLPEVAKVVANSQLSLNENFSDELNDKNSDEYKKMSLKTKKALRDIYINLVGFQDVTIIGFKSGSIVIIYQIIFQKSEKTSNLELMKIMLKNATELAISEGKLGEYRVFKDSFKIHAVFIAHEEKVNRHPYWFIYASLGLLLLLVLVVVCIVKRRSKRRSQRELYGMFDNEAYDAVEMKDKDERQGEFKIPEMYGVENVLSKDTDDAQTSTKIDNPENRDIDMTSFRKIST